MAKKKSSSSKRSSTSADNVLSLDRKLDITGVIMVAVGLVTLLALLTQDAGIIMGTYVSILEKVFGYGLYLFPVALISVGIWLILRNFESFPSLSIERGVGIGLLFFNIIALIHFFYFPEQRADSLNLARNGVAGGYVGYGLTEVLITGFGMGGAAVALSSWLIIALAMSLDVSVLGLFRWIPPLFRRLGDAWVEFQAKRAERKRKAVYTQMDMGLDSKNPGMQPITVTSPTAQKDEVPPWEEDPEQRTWVLPSPADILDEGDDLQIDDEIDRHRAQIIEETLNSFGAPATVVEINRGPTITQFGVEPDFIEKRDRRTRVRVNKITALADDLALALAATRIRVQAPVPGKGFVGIEVPNEDISLVALRDIIESEAFQRLENRPLRFALGQDVSGNAIAADLSGMPHLLIAGTTGSGKSVCVNSLISCLLMHNTPDQLRLLMVDPKRVELTGYDGIPHLLSPVVVELERVVGALQWITREMDQRYHKFAKIGARNLEDFNSKASSYDEKELPFLVVIIDELADLMMVAPEETERTITRLAQMARATGIHLVIATQRPSVDVVTGLIKANFPARVAFAVASSVDSRVILDQPGAERLLGRGDMLFQAPDAASPVRLQGVFVSDEEIFNLVQYWRMQAGYVSKSGVTATGGIPDQLPRGIPLKQIEMFEKVKEEEDRDPLYDEAVDLIRREGRASISMLQRRLRIGYTRSARLIENIESNGIIGPQESGSLHREVLDYGPAAPPADAD